ncbi:DUF4394 domain-containing protein [Sandaracinobacteroides saxicola]|uniref:DUF4394 domain-containing protein n=1 Tax=Sandaracinobacteroides saxicola TaxID=2759707 RepID=A0A7G5IMI6_9SPHN|nr:DUF4394 domain-containing protein [Sandaracinobacteroides saxicola]QMW24578.1 DUF4394 domain-containing protein [Sandaracinobacteroides saxicola]
MRLLSFVLLAAAIATPASAERLYGLTLDNRIVNFDSADPETITGSRTITGISDTIIGLDVRPATGTLHALTGTGKLYELKLNGMTYQATLKGTVSPTPSGGAFGVDFNPVPDRLRVVGSTGQNLRINPNNGVTVVDTPVTIGGMTPQLVAAGYTNSVAGAASTTLYALDAAGDRLLRSTNPNGGIYVDTNLTGQTFGPLGFAFTTDNNVGFDISPNSGIAYANIDSLLWRVDLMTGAGTALGIVGAGPLRSIATPAFGAAVPEPATWAMLILGFGLVGTSLRQRRRIAA